MVVFFFRVSFLAHTLLKERKTHRLAFELALSMLELPRNPSATKFMEVKLYHLVGWSNKLLLNLLHDIFLSLLKVLFMSAVICLVLLFQVFCLAFLS